MKTFEKESYSILSLQKSLKKFYTKKELDLKIREYKSFYIKAQFERKSLKVFLHKMFLFSSEKIIKSIMDLVLKNDKKALSAIHAFADIYFSKKPNRKRRLQKKGVYYNLETIYSDLNEKYFNNEVSTEITWFKKPNYKKWNCITFGSYDPTYQLIKINALLDDPFFPKYFVDYVVYHEMLHFKNPAVMDNRGRKRVHTKDFKYQEKNFSEYVQAKKWEKDFLKKIKERFYGRS